MLPKTKSARLAVLFFAAIGLVVGLLLLLDRVTTADRDAEPATVLDGRYYPPDELHPEGIWVVEVRTDKGETVVAVRPKGLPGLRAGDRVQLITHRGLVGVSPRREVR